MGGAREGYLLQVLENTCRTTNDPPQRVPRPVVKPVEKLAVPVNGHVVGER